jgi:hypothetical protein
LSRLSCNRAGPASYGHEGNEHASVVDDETATLVDLIISPCGLERVQEYDDPMSKPKPVTATTLNADASTLTGVADESSSRMLTSKIPRSLSTAAKVRESNTPRVYLPPTDNAAGIEQERRENAAARAVLDATTDALDDDAKRQM